MDQNPLEVAAARLMAAADDLQLISSVCEERAVQELLTHPHVGEGWRKWVEWRRKVLTPIVPPEAPPVPEEEAGQSVTEEPAAEEAGVEVDEDEKVFSEEAEVPEEIDVLRVAEEAAEERQRLYEARKRAYESLIAAAKAAGVFIDPNEEIEVGGRTMRSITYLLGRIVSGEETPEEAVKEAVALGWASSYLGASPEAYDSLLQAAQEAGLWVLKRVYRPDGRELRPVSELARKIEAGAISAKAAVELARKAGWTAPLRRPTNEETPNGGLATIGEQLEVKNNLQQQLAEANRRKEEAIKAQQNAGGGKKKKK
jgi:hypothetical protein